MRWARLFPFFRPFFVSFGHNSLGFGRRPGRGLRGDELPPFRIPASHFPPLPNGTPAAPRASDRQIKIAFFIKSCYSQSGERKTQLCIVWGCTHDDNANWRTWVPPSLCNWAGLGVVLATSGFRRSATDEIEAFHG